MQHGWPRAGSELSRRCPTSEAWPHLWVPRLDGPGGEGALPLFISMSCSLHISNPQLMALRLKEHSGKDPSEFESHG